MSPFDQRAKRRIMRRCGMVRAVSTIRSVEMAIPTAGDLIGSEPHTQSDLLRCFSAEIGRLSGVDTYRELRDEVEPMCAKLAAAAPADVDEAEMDATDLIYRLVDAFNEIGNPHGLEFGIDDRCGIWGYSAERYREEKEKERRYNQARANRCDPNDVD